MQRYEKVRAEANGKRSFRHRRPRNGPRTAVCLSSRRRSCLPPGPVSSPLPSLSRPAHPPPGPVPFGRVCCRRLRLVYRPVLYRPVLFRPPPSPLPSPACPLPFPSFRPAPARRRPLSGFICRPFVALSVPPSCRPILPAAVPLRPLRPPGATRGARPNILPIFHYFARILYFCETKNKIQKAYTYGKSL